METLTFRQPRIVALALLVIIAAGLSSLLAIGRQEDPTITNLFATITTPYPGADPARVETLVTAEIEDALREIPEVDEINSTSATGISIVQVDLLDTLADDRIEQVWSEIRDALGDAQAAFPQGVMTPDFSSDGAGTFGAIIALSANHKDVPLSIMGRFGESLADDIRSLSGTKQVETFGGPQEEVLVTLDPIKAATLGLSADDVAGAIARGDSKGQAGRLRSFANEMIIDVAGDITALERVRTLILREGPQGQVTRISDVAEVTRGPRLPLSEAALHNGAPAVLIAAKLEDGLQVDIWMGRVKTALAAFQGDVPSSITAELIFDQSRYTAERLAEVGGNMAIGVALVVGVLLITMGVRAALIVALILPLVSLATLATMNVIGLAIHQMSVTGLIVALGLLVDAGIVMTDEVGQRIAKGETRHKAVKGSVRRLFAPLLASTVTTALSFTPMILLPGPAGDFVGSIAIAVVTMLLWSFVIAVTVTPAIAGWVMPAAGKTGIIANGIKSRRLSQGFAATLRWAMRNPLRSVAFSLVLPVLGFMSMPLLTAQFFPGVERDQFHIEVDLRPGAAIGQTRQVAERLDALLRAAPEVRQVSWVIAKSAPAFYYNMVSARADAARFAQALVTTHSPAATETLIARLEREIGAVAPEAQVLVRGLVQGPPVDAPVELRLVGPDLDTLRATGAQMRRIISDVDAVTLSRGTVSTGAPEVSLTVNEAKARQTGFDLSMISRQLEAGLEGVTGGSLLEGSEELPVRVRFGDATRSDLSAIADMILLPPDAAAQSARGLFPGVPLSAIADVTLTPGEPIITRRNAERVNTIQAFILRDVLPEEALAQVRAALDAEGFTLPAGYRLEIGGDSDARAETLGNLLASLGLIVTLSIAAIVMTFNSFRLSAIALIVSVLSAGLSILALAIFQYPFGINAIIGVIGSIGVSINAAIIIMTGLRDDPGARLADPEAMVDVLMGSSRHIISTTITTFGGFLPLILAGGGFWPPFAMSVAGGVLLSTVVSFYFTPPMFALLYAGKTKTTPPEEAMKPSQATALKVMQAAE
ncbi:Cobalt-zinc-cadmium resistance protein CzcA [Roseobacter fucihabitans]|uniref:Cobalt-zinc-cadmium resistance protein CzcA n=1 Tax=Roseobacter fucihabitans TaxID=1537242 RepID=A0ABZ2BUB6_9RHOB|nr:efflux RND transporter permease subunit [Roseobacter litoralis]MBC6965804.1 Cobalt-zinc-cadmium resistance protein CzcA [Roseobacter litoralis]